MLRSREMERSPYRNDRTDCAMDRSELKNRGLMKGGLMKGGSKKRRLMKRGLRMLPVAVVVCAAFAGPGGCNWDRKNRDAVKQVHEHPASLHEHPASSGTEISGGADGRHSRGAGTPGGAMGMDSAGGSMVSDEAGHMAREDQSRAARAAGTKKRTRPPDRPVDRSS